MIHLARNAFPPSEFKKIPIVILDTNYLFEETWDYIDYLKTEWRFVDQLTESIIGLNTGTAPDIDKFECCMERKTKNLREILNLLDLDAIMVGIRRDEQEIRNKERFFSPRDTDGRWDYWNQDMEMQGWDLYTASIGEGEHMRVHPILEWSEVDCWEYIKLHDIPVNPLYFSKDGKRRHRSIGCEPCTSPFKSNANTLDEIIEELEEIGGSERDGREQDKEDRMNKLRALGYMSWFFILFNFFLFSFGGIS